MHEQSKICYGLSINKLDIFLKPPWSNNMFLLSHCQLYFPTLSEWVLFGWDREKILAFPAIIRTALKQTGQLQRLVGIITK